MHRRTQNMKCGLHARAVSGGLVCRLPLVCVHTLTSYYSNESWSIPFPRRFCKLDVLAIAHRKWGTMAVLEEERAAAAAKSSRAKQSREAQRDKRE